MRKIKFSAVFATIGFILSFIAGFFSHSSFVLIFLKALLWALIFGILGFGINIVYERFLNESSDQDFTTDSTPSGMPQPQKGQLVDITIQDEELQDSGSGNHFVVGSNRQMLHSVDVRSNNTQPQQPVQQSPAPGVNSAPAGNFGAPAAKEFSAKPLGTPSAGSSPAQTSAPDAGNKMAGSNLEAAASASGFVPVRNLETITNVSSKEAVKSSDFSSSQESSGSNVDDELDVLPDMEGLSFAENEDDNDVDTDTDSEFVSVHKKSGDENPANIKDAELMAKAISDVLSRDDS